MSLPRVRRFIARNKLPVIVLLASTAALLWFTAAFIKSFIYFHDPQHQDEVLKQWMSPRYVAMSYDLPRSLVLDVLQITREGGGHKSLGDLARDQGVSLSELERRVRDAAAAYRNAAE